MATLSPVPAVTRAQALRDDALETDLAGVPEHDVAGLGNMLAGRSGYPNKSLAESNKSDSPVPSYSGRRLLLIAFGAA
jgi:hypothetical protein